MKATKVSRRGQPAAAATKPLAIAPHHSPELWPSAMALGAAVIAVFFVYGPAMSGPFLLDDSYLPYRLDDFANAPLRDWMRGLRPLLMLSFWMNFQEAHDNTGPYHFFNVLLHLLNGGFAFLIVRKILQFAKVEKSRVEVLAAFCSGLFLLHPLQTESVSYIASRSETLSVFFLLAAFTVFLYRRSESTSWLISLLVLLLFGAACLTKEHAVVLPGVFLLTDYFWNPGFSLAGMRRNWKLYVPIAAGALAGLAFVAKILRTAANTSAGFNVKEFTWYQYFFTECRALWRYILLFVFPVDQNIDHDFPISRTIFDHGAVIGLAGLIALLAAAWFYRKRFPLICYGVFTVLLLFAPTSSFVPILDPFVEHRMYLPFIGLLFITAGVLQFWKATRATLIGTLTVVLLIEAGLTYQRNRLWANATDIWADSVSKSPKKWRPNFQLAYAYYNQQQCPAAVNQFAKTATLQKPDYSLYVDWGLAADCAGNSSEALAKLQEAGKLQRSAHIYSQIGMEYAKLSEFPQALDALNTAIKLDPNFGRIYIYRGNIYALQGKRQEAVAEYQHALKIDPADQYARDGLMKLMQR